MEASDLKKGSFVKNFAVAAAATALCVGGAVADTIVITDQRDRTITLDGEVERVVTIPIPAASVFI